MCGKCTKGGCRNAALVSAWASHQRPRCPALHRGGRPPLPPHRISEDDAVEQPPLDVGHRHVPEDLPLARACARGSPLSTTHTEHATQGPSPRASQQRFSSSYMQIDAARHSVTQHCTPRRSVAQRSAARTQATRRLLLRRVHGLQDGQQLAHHKGHGHKHGGQRHAWSGGGLPGGRGGGRGRAGAGQDRGKQAAVLLPVLRHGAMHPFHSFLPATKNAHKSRLSPTGPGPARPTRPPSLIAHPGRQR